MTVRCPECNHKNGHSPHCRAGIDESRPWGSDRPVSSAQILKAVGLPGDVCGPAVPVDGYPPHHKVGDCDPRAGLKEPRTSLPTNPLARKHVPLASGLLDYFPAALAAVAILSRIGNEQHNPGSRLAWDRSKSGDEADALLRHLAERGTVDTDGVRHSVKVAWRALANLQKELEEAGEAPVSPGSINHA